MEIGCQIALCVRHGGVLRFDGSRGPAPPGSAGKSCYETDRNTPSAEAWTSMVFRLVDRSRRDSCA